MGQRKKFSLDSLPLNVQADAAHAQAGEAGKRGGKDVGNMGHRVRVHDQHGADGAGNLDHASEQLRTQLIHNHRRHPLRSSHLIEMAPAGTSLG